MSGKPDQWNPVRIQNAVFGAPLLWNSNSVESAEYLTALHLDPSVIQSMLNYQNELKNQNLTKLAGTTFFKNFNSVTQNNIWRDFSISYSQL